MCFWQSLTQLRLFAPQSPSSSPLQAFVDTPPVSLAASVASADAGADLQHSLSSDALVGGLGSCEDVPKLQSQHPAATESNQLSAQVEGGIIADALPPYTAKVCTASEDLEITDVGKDSGSQATGGFAGLPLPTTEASVHGPSFSPGRARGALPQLPTLGKDEEENQV